MKELQPRRVIVLSLLIGLAVSAALAWSMARQDHQADDHLELERRAAYRFEHYRGLTPCDPETLDITSAARAALRREGVTDSGMVAIVAPTFHGAKVAGFGTSAIDVLHFKGDTGYTRPEAWFQVVNGKPVSIPLSPRDHFAIVTPLSRHIRFADTRSRSGLDGVTYFLELGGHCGYSWSPRREDGPSGLIAELLKELAQPQPSLEALLILAAEIDQQDRSFGGG